MRPSSLIRSTCISIAFSRSRCDSFGDSRYKAFTLVELLVVISIVGLLLGLVLPAVQAARESARRVSCTNNLHNQVVALTAYHSAHHRLPPGHMVAKVIPVDVRLDYSWVAYILPHIEQAPLYQQMDFSVPWSDSRNIVSVNTSLEMFRCPSSELEFPGDCDYAGILGSAMNTRPGEESVDGKVFNRGVLVNAFRREEGVRFAEVTDGASNTLAVTEAPDFTEEEDGYWVSGAHSISHDSGGVNTDPNGIASLHPGGAHGARIDGSVSFITDDTEPAIIGALCTRSADDNVSSN